MSNNETLCTGGAGTMCFTYDKNGNLTKDLNKNISSIQYNLLNLPTNITYSSGKSAAYVYDATGKKLRTSYKASASATAVPTDYCGNMIYENNVLKQILIDGGYITLSGTAPYYHYYLKDHLGNNRVVVSPAGTAEQINHYYPFGGLFGESTGNTVQRFRFNGKEFDRTHGIDWYDYGARHMTPDAGRFTTIDPMAEKYYNTSPYVYCANNPVNYIDLRGDSLTLTGEQEDIDKTLDIYNKGLGGYYSVKADNNGLVSISPITGKDPSEMRREQQTFYSVISSAVEGEGMAKINIVNNSDEVIIANALNKAIDIGDINAIGDGPYINKYSVIAHETYEAYNFQARNIPLIKAHLNASGIENLMTGSYIDPLQRNIKANGLSSIPIRSKNGNKIIHTINIYTVNGNVKKVSR